MKLLKPSWVNHGENSIFSVDVHPDGSRFATGGQGQDSGKIIIWNMGPVIDKTKENDKDVPRVLCQMDHHIACVNVVRWSNNGLFLASGSDDKLIMIWQYANGGMAYQNIENWKCGYTLRGHSGDVMDLAWSAKDQYLATCSIDNTVIIWNALKFPDIICRINAHAGLVKGVAWDPVGIYFASQSDDKTLKIWRTLDWSLEKSVEEPFKHCAGTTHVLRLGWSPDGQLVISAHAINNGAPTAQSIDRGNKWDTKLDFVGHRKAVTAVRFYPQILKPAEAKHSNSSDFKTHCLFALGSRDRSISIWLTNYSRPLTVIKDLFDNPIMDLSWSKGPKPGLLACSMDGTVSYIEFNFEEIGYPLSKSEVEDFFMKKYGHDVNATVCLKPNNINQQMNQQQPSKFKKDQSNSIKFIENLDILMAQEEKQKQQAMFTNENSSNTQFHNNNSMTMTPSKLQILTENQKQIERRMPDGRRRITPICVCKPGEYDTPKPFGSEDNFNKVGFERSIGFGSPNEIKISSKTATEQSTIIVEKRDEKNEIVEISPVKSIIYNKTSNLNSSNSNDVVMTSQTPAIPKIAVVNNKPSNNDVIISTANPIKPTATPTLNIQSNNNNNNNKTPITLPQKTNVSTKITAPTAPSSAKTTQSLNNSTPSTLNNNNKPKPAINSNINNKNQTNLSQAIEQTVVTSAKQVLSPKVTTTPNKSNSINDQSIQHSIYQQYLTPLRIDKKLVTKIITEKGLNRSAISVEIHNSISLIELPSATSLNSNNESDFNLNLVRYFVDYKLKWQVYLSKKLCEIACSSNILACVCIDSTVHFFKANNGIQICCPIILDSRAAVLKCNTNYCMCLTVNGFVYVWKYENNLNKQNDSISSINDKKNNNNINNLYSDLNNLSTIINRQSCQSILKDGIFSNALLTENGIPVIYMSKNRSFFFSLQTECWHLIPSIGNLIGQDSQLIFNSSSLFSDQFKSMKTSDDSLMSNIVPGPLSIIQSKDKSSSLLKTIELMNKSSINDNPLINQQDFTLTHLESQVNASVGLNSSKEYKFWLMTYARYLTENDYEDKLNDLCKFFLGPLYSLNWNEKILNFKKRDLLKEILSIIAQNLRLQRVHAYYKQQLNMMNNMNPVKNNNILNRLTAPILNEETNNFQKNIQTSTSKAFKSSTPFLPINFTTETTSELMEVVETNEEPIKQKHNIQQTTLITTNESNVSKTIKYKSNSPPLTQSDKNFESMEVVETNENVSNTIESKSKSPNYANEKVVSSNHIDKIIEINKEQIEDNKNNELNENQEHNTESKSPNSYLPINETTEQNDKILTNNQNDDDNNIKLIENKEKVISNENKINDLRKDKIDYLLAETTPETDSESNTNSQLESLSLTTLETLRGISENIISSNVSKTTNINSTTKPFVSESMEITEPNDDNKEKILTTNPKSPTDIITTENSKSKTNTSENDSDSSTDTSESNTNSQSEPLSPTIRETLRGDGDNV